MPHWMKAGTLLLGSLAFVAGTPADSSAQFFPWLYDSMYGPPGYSYGYDPYGYGYYGSGYYSPGYQTAYYGPGFGGYGWGGDCGCRPACNACGGSCGAGCPGGNCGMTPAPAGRPTPTPEGPVDPTAPPTTPPSRPTRPTFDPDSPDAPVYEPPERGSRSGSPGRSLPDDSFERRGTPRRSNEPATGGAAGAPDGFDAGSDPNTIDTPGGARKPPLGKPAETVIPQKKPAEAAPVEEADPSTGGPNLDDRSASRPVIEKQRLVLRSNYGAPQLVRAKTGPGTKWSGLDTRIVRH